MLKCWTLPNPRVKSVWPVGVKSRAREVETSGCWKTQDVAEWLLNSWAISGWNTQRQQRHSYQHTPPPIPHRDPQTGQPSVLYSPIEDSLCITKLHGRFEWVRAQSSVLVSFCQSKFWKYTVFACNLLSWHTVLFKENSLFWVAPLECVFLYV